MNLSRQRRIERISSDNRHCEDRAGAALDLVAQPDAVPAPSAGTESCLLHSKYRLPASCFGYVGDAAAPATWKLPYRLADGSPDARRLPKAVQCILSNYRGAKVAGVPESAIPEVLERLGRVKFRWQRRAPAWFRPSRSPGSRRAGRRGRRAGG